MENSIENINEFDKEISLKEILLNFAKVLNFLVSKWLIIVITSLLGATIGFLIAKYKSPLYTASTTFVIQSGDQDGNLGQYAGIASMMGFDMGGGNGSLFQGENILELYKSRKMIEAAMLRPVSYDSSINILDLYLLQAGMFKEWQKDSSTLLEVNFQKINQENDFLQRQRDSVLNEVVLEINKTYLNVGKIDKKLSLLKIDVKSKNEVFAKEFNSALVNEVNSFYISTKTKKSLDNIEILQHKTDSVRAVMNGAISSAVVAIDNTPNLNLTKQSQRLVPAQRSQYSVEANKAILSQLIQNLEMSKMALLKETPLIQIVDEPVYPLVSEKLSKIKNIILYSFIFTFFIVSILLCQRFYYSLIK
ncbi:Chain length determinant protein [Sphingobacterium nematocida]|uniref:Chain length determinant protein n=1 Tax=Sphingobacterium nematocida TaxID=1513896 RepID=A0A1T5EXY1_9SPHI|nr:hypothetical protein [Sphingobacterium nematocida]SKB88728.1 Chain length determinant protein [Sphingobacterium nematocida]